MKVFRKLITFGILLLVGAGTLGAQVSRNSSDANSRLVQGVIREGLSDLDLPVSLLEGIQDYREEQRALVEERRQLVEVLRNATTEQAREVAIATFKRENEGRLALQRALAEHLRESLKEIRIARTERPELPAPLRPELDEDVLGILREFNSVRQALIDERREVLERLRDATKEEREAGILAMRNEQREQLEMQREMAQQIRESFKELREERRGKK